MMLMPLLAAPAMAQKVYVDYDQSVDFDSYRTFAWKAPTEASLEEESPLMHSRIESAIESALTSGGLAMDTEDPDLYVTYHTSSKEEVTFSTTHMGYDYGPGWGWDPYWDGWGGMGMGMGTSTTTAHTYERGTLVIDVWDARTNRAIFRGSAEAVVKEKPERAAKQIEKAIMKIGKKFDSMQAKRN
ncbi:MAG: hypothetical protein AMS21_11450 [Gemmatimonas sp. SG8_38_2]|nr:MAG: hypothetical protein AMS21_11450 [Gemmatimonas sp. SG8_38_2]